MIRPLRFAGARLLLAGVLTLWAVPAAIGETSPYRGQQARAIKSLSDEDVAALLAGQGAGYAKAAELNGYPGPAHVLELADGLHLSRAQLDATRTLFEEHRARARELGQRLVEAERELDELFASQRAAPTSVDEATAKVAGLQARLRAEHLKTHLAQARLLDAEQRDRYAALRGYAGGTLPSAADHSHHTGRGRP